jgi:hypothetical protein
VSVQAKIAECKECWKLNKCDRWNAELDWRQPPSGRFVISVALSVAELAFGMHYARVAG